MLHGFKAPKFFCGQH